MVNQEVEGTVEGEDNQRKLIFDSVATVSIFNKNVPARKSSKSILLKLVFSKGIVESHCNLKTYLILRLFPLLN